MSTSWLSVAEFVIAKISSEQNENRKEVEEDRPKGTEKDFFLKKTRHTTGKFKTCMHCHTENQKRKKEII